VGARYGTQKRRGEKEEQITPITTPGGSSKGGSIQVGGDREGGPVDITTNQVSPRTIKGTSHTEQNKKRLGRQG